MDQASARAMHKLRGTFQSDSVSSESHQFQRNAWEKNHVCELSNETRKLENVSQPH